MSDPAADGRRSRTSTTWSLARQRARQVAALLGFDAQDQTRIATAVSEIARNAFVYAGGGRVEFALEGEQPPQVLRSRVADHGPGIARPRRRPRRHAIARRPAWASGIVGARRLMDHFDDRVGAGAARPSRLSKLLPRGAPALDAARRSRALAAELARERAGGPIDEVQQQNQELLRALDELQRAPGGADRGSTASWRTPTAAWSRSTPSSTRRPITCGAPTR